MDHRRITRATTMLTVVAVVAGWGLLVPGRAIAAATSQVGNGNRTSSKIVSNNRIAAPAQADSPVTITFSEYPAGTIVTNQYEPEGILFAGDTPGDNQVITDDSSNPTSPVLSGTPTFVGDVGGSFVVPSTTTPATVNTFSLDVGYIDDPGSTQVNAYGVGGQLLGSVLANDLGINLLTVSYPGIARFVVTSTFEEDAGYAVDNVSFSPGEVAGTYVALGDSFSSGEGNPPYLPGSNKNGDQCDRSALAYPLQSANDLGYYAPNFSFHACSGAGILDFTHRNRDYASEPRQESWLGSGDALVTFTIGGNNADFPNAMTTCLTPGTIGLTCQATWQAIVNSRIADMAGTAPSDTLSLYQLYEQVKLAAPNARVLVVGYPRFFPLTPPRVCFIGPATLVRGQMNWIDGEVKKIDNTIATAARKAGVSYVSTYGAFKGHEFCQSSPDFNRIDFPHVFGSLHPDAAGHQALASAVEAAYNS